MRSTVLFLEQINERIYTWTIQKNRCIKFEKIGIVTSFQTKDRSPNDDVVSVTEQVNKFFCKFRKSRSTVKCEDRSLGFLYPEIDSAQNEEELTSRVMPPIVFPNSKASSTLPHFDRKMEPKGINKTTPPLKTNYGNISEEEKIAEDVLKCLYRMLLGPVRHLVEGTQLVVEPEGPLHLVPFSALMDEHGHYVAESLQVRLVPSLTTEKMIVENQLELDPQGKPLIGIRFMSQKRGRKAQLQRSVFISCTGRRITE